MLRDVTETVEMLRRLREQATTDSLTGLLVRRRLVELGRREVDRARRQSRPLAVLLIDVDGFKTINDAYGHPAGDELLRAVADALRSQVRQGVDCAARYGGEEFAVLIRGDASQGCELGERLRRAVEEVTVVVRNGRTTGATVSVGVASYPGVAADEGQLIERADAALYASKRRGRNRVTIATLVAPQDAVELSA